MPRSPKAHALPREILCGILLGVLALSGAHANEVEKLMHRDGMEEPYNVISPTRAPWEWRQILSPLDPIARLRFGTSSGSGSTVSTTTDSSIGSGTTDSGSGSGTTGSSRTGSTSTGSGTAGSGSSRRLLDAESQTARKGKMKPIGGTQRKHARQMGQMRGNQSPKHRERKRPKGKARKGTQF
jgi:hypothetical protein